MLILKIEEKAYANQNQRNRWQINFKHQPRSGQPKVSKPVHLTLKDLQS